MDTTQDRNFISYSDCVIRLRMSMFRNCTGYPFPTRMQTADSHRFLNMVSKRMERLPEGDWTLHRLEKMSDDDFFYYRDRGLLPTDFGRLSIPVFFYTDKNGASLFFLNREGIELSTVSSEFDPFHSLTNLIESDRQLETVFPYAVSLRHGYLNSRLDRTGAGLEAEVLLSLPALNRTEEGNRLLKIAAAENLHIEPYVCPVLKTQIDGILSVSTTALNGETEEEMTARFAANLGTIVKMERLKRRDWQSGKIEEIRTRYLEALDRINLSMKITLREAYDILDTVRAAVLAGVADHPCSTVNWLFDFLKESYLIRFRNRFAGSSEPMMYDSLRAHLLKDIFCGKAEVLCIKD